MSVDSSPKHPLDAGGGHAFARFKRARRGASPYDAFLPGPGTTTNANGNTNLGDMASFQPGAIRRVKLTDFVTYSSAEFFPGPSLNMVIGPNGTGKSTLVCAICIGLGYDPKYLGRAKDVSEFVKHGAQEAFIELELQRSHKTSTNPIIRCKIKRDGNKAMYTINKRPFSSKQVKQQMGNLGVQIDNLCQFLPQDRVVEFAGMTPVELLNSTQRAVATQQMLDWHDQLKVLRKTQRELQQVKKTQDDELASLEAHQRRQEADVQRIRDRQEVRDTISKLDGIRPLIEYDEKVAKFKESKAVVEGLAEELQNLQEAVEPAMRKVNAKAEYKASIAEAAEEQRQNLRDCFEKVTAQQLTVRELDASLDKHNDNTKSQRQNMKKSQALVVQSRNQIRDLEARLAQPQTVSQETMDAVYEKIRRLGRQERENADAFEQLQDEHDSLEQQVRQREQGVQQQEARLRDLNSKAGRQNEKLNRVSRDTARAWAWIQKNQDMFEQKVYGPPMLECSVKNPREVDMIELMIPQAEMLMITTQTSKDFVTLQRKLREQNLSRVNQRHVAADLQRFRRPARQEELQRYGMDGWVIDRISGPDVCLASLCEGAKLHLTAFAPRELSEEQFQAASASNINQWITPGGSYRVSRRQEYGPSATATTTRAVRKAKFWSEEPVDVNVAEEMKRRIAELTDEKNELDIQIKELGGNRKRVLQQKKSDLSGEQADAKQELTRLQRMKRDQDALPIKLSQAKERLAQRQDDAKAEVDKLADLESAYDDNLTKKADAAVRFAELVEAAHVVLERLQEAEIMLIEATSDCDILADRNREITNQLEEKQRRHDDAKQACKALRLEVGGLAKRLKTFTAKMSNELRDFFDEVRARLNTSVSLQAEIQSQEARLSLLQGDDSGRTLVAYEERAKRIEALREKIGQCADALDEVTTKITSIRGRWEPRLEKLVTRISKSFEYNMKQINCSGEVDIFKDEDDFDRWAISIKVKFRENEPLSQLDSHRQSGGERAVSTIFYLMSLQALTRSPFRVVDEINQGMDPRNERLVHARMVSIATGQDDMPVEQIKIPRHRRDDDDDEEHDDENENMNANSANNDQVNGQGLDEDEPSSELDQSDLGGSSRDETRHQAQTGSQYFLITPKLLPNLRYEPGMRILCIGSGEHMPAEQGVIDFQKALQLRRGALTAAAAAG